MKTSLVLEDELFDSAKKEAQKTGKTISQIIGEWARAGKKMVKKQKVSFVRFTPVNLGSPSKIDLSNRSHWMDELE